jgi:GNAT superfamily N-acetyltransferase
MSAVQVRPFRRSDRDQLTDLVNAHAQAVVPGMSASVSTVLSSLESQPGEFITDPWISDRVTLVAEQASRIAAAAHLRRYYPDERAGAAARDTGEIAWFLFWPLAPAGNSCWPDAAPAADGLMTACLAKLGAWGVSRQDADGGLPVPGVYGVPAQWPHIEAIYQRAGFRHAGHTEIVYLAAIADLARPPALPFDGLTISRSVGINGTRLSATLGDDVIGFIEVETFDDGERSPRHAGWATVGNLRVETPWQRRGVATWLLGQAARWLDLAGVAWLLDYAWLEGTDPGGLRYDSYRSFLSAAGFTELTRTRRGWTRESA